MSANTYTDPDSFQVTGPSVLDISAKVPGGNITTDGNGNITAVSIAAQLVGLTPLSATSPVLATSGTITTAGVACARVAPAGAVTGIILQPGTKTGQLVTVLNESANTITMAAKATSNVQSGVTNVIPANAAATYIWDSSLGTPVWICIGMGL